MLSFIVIIRTDTNIGPYYFVLEMSGYSIPAFEQKEELKEFINYNTVFICDEVISVIYNGMVVWEYEEKEKDDTGRSLS